MVLSPEARVLSGDQIRQVWQANRQTVAVFTSTFTPGLSVNELVFPDSGVQFIVPRLGWAAFQVETPEGDRWLMPFEVRLTTQAEPVYYLRGNLIAVALVPENGCQMDVETGKQN